ncbi:MAG: aspartate ammonia-lyase [Deltaproteobacteria bacterium]|nr:aspartate ammonia-lyase [Deltaproteobacteria bacterium]MCL4872537.1 aspartate ammonia-lyase [bacterium]
MRRIRTFRLERDSLGEREVPRGAYYGIQTLRASENFRISGLRPPRALIRATGIVKLAACRANSSLGLLEKRIAKAISEAADEVIDGRLDSEFIVDVFQAGAGTSHNMNANEVIANRAIEILGGKKGDYRLVHPNDHVNMGQSTNDTMPTALRIAAISESDRLIDALGGLEAALRAKSREFKDVIKSGRTHLQDAVPITLGQEFGSWASAVKSSIKRVERAREGLKRIGLGGTAVGTGINTHPGYRDAALRELSKAGGIKGLRKAEDPFEALSSSTDFSSFSGALRDAALDLIRIANDLRLLSSGPMTGLSEIMLPPVQPGSSIMPGKVNPVMAEMADMVGFQVIGADAAIAAATQAGQLELNVMLPVIGHNLLHSIDILSNACLAFSGRCVKGIKADSVRCRRYFEASAGLATALNTIIGYERAAEVVKESAKTGKSIKETALGKGVLTGPEWDRLFDPKRITRPAESPFPMKKRRTGR